MLINQFANIRLADTFHNVFGTLGISCIVIVFVYHSCRLILNPPKGVRVDCFVPRFLIFLIPRGSNLLVISRYNCKPSRADTFPTDHLLKNYSTLISASRLESSSNTIGSGCCKIHADCKLCLWQIITSVWSQSWASRKEAQFTDSVLVVDDLRKHHGDDWAQSKEFGEWKNCECNKYNSLNNSKCVDCLVWILKLLDQWPYWYKLYSIILYSYMSFQCLIKGIINPGNWCWDKVYLRSHSCLINSFACLASIII